MIKWFSIIFLLHLFHSLLFYLPYRLWKYEYARAMFMLRYMEFYPYDVSTYSKYSTYSLKQMGKKFTTKDSQSFWPMFPHWLINPSCAVWIGMIYFFLTQCSPSHRSMKKHIRVLVPRLSTLQQLTYTKYVSSNINGCSALCNCKPRECDSEALWGPWNWSG